MGSAFQRMCSSASALPARLALGLPECGRESGNWAEHLMWNRTEEAARCGLWCRFQNKHSPQIQGEIRKLLQPTWPNTLPVRNCSWRIHRGSNLLASEVPPDFSVRAGDPTAPVHLEPSLGILRPSDFQICCDRPGKFVIPICAA